MIKHLIAKLFLSKKRKQQLQDISRLINEVKGVDSEAGCREVLQKVVEFNYTLKSGDHLKEICGKLFDFISDTNFHVMKGYHKPQHNGWKTVTSYPDINDYVDVGVKIKRF